MANMLARGYILETVLFSWKAGHTWMVYYFTEAQFASLLGLKKKIASFCLPFL